MAECRHAPMLVSPGCRTPLSRSVHSRFRTAAQRRDAGRAAAADGDLVVVKTGDRLEVLATNTLSNQSFIASPIAVERDLYLRSRTHLFRITESASATR